MPRKGNIENVIFWGNRYTNPVETGFMVEILWTSYLPGWRLGKQSGDRRMNGTLYDILVRGPNTHTHTHTHLHTVSLTKIYQPRGTRFWSIPTVQYPPLKMKMKMKVYNE